MNNETQKLFSRVWLADAAYADFSAIDLDDDSAVSRRLRDTRSFGDTEADQFVAAWKVRDFLNDTTTSGFSATVFESKTNPGQFSFALRGTQGFLIGGRDLVVTDLSDIALDGLAMDQIVDMYNYWQQLTAPKDSSYQIARLDGFFASVPPGFTTVGTIVDLPTLLPRVLRLGASAAANGLGIIPANASGIDVTGHSLGGHLAMAFGRIFSQFNPTIWSANGAGFGETPEFLNSNVPNLLNGLAGRPTSFGDSRIINLYGTAGIDVITQNIFGGLTQQGERIPVFTESALKSAVGHGVDQITLSAAVYDLLFRLDSNLGAMAPSAAINALTPIFKGAMLESSVRVN